MQSVVNEKHVFLLRSALAQVFPCAGIVSFTQPELYGAHNALLATLSTNRGSTPSRSYLGAGSIRDLAQVTLAQVVHP